MTTFQLIGRVLATVVLALLVAGFGLCGVAGLANVGNAGEVSGLLLACGLAGVGIAVFAGVVIYRLWRPRGQREP